MSPSSILLRGGTLLLHDSNDRVNAINADLLIEGNKIKKIGENIKQIATNTSIIDCSGKIVSPGFVDTHRHLWQTQLKGRHGNELLFDYIPTGNLAGSLFTPEDIFWGQLAGALESIDAGTTMVVDFSHVNYSVEDAKKAIAATATSGLRSFYCYSNNSNVEGWHPHLTFKQTPWPEYYIEQLSQLIKSQPFGSGRVQLGLTWDAWYLPQEMVAPIFKQAREGGIKLITCHANRGPTLSYTPLDFLDKWGLLGSDVLVAHDTNPLADEAARLRDVGAHVSSTPSTELLMALGNPVCFDDEFFPIASLGIDCHSVCSADIPSQMRYALNHARASRSQRILEARNKTPKAARYTVEQAFNLGTIMGARAAKMGGEIGSLEEGKLADIVIFNPLSPAMICAAQHDPVTAVVMHSSIRDVETVILDGIIRKIKGELLAVQVDPGAGIDKQTLEWSEIGIELLKSRQKIQEKVNKIDYSKVRVSMIKAIAIDESTISDE